MKYLVDECTGPIVAAWLRSEGNEVFSVYDEARGQSDAWILSKATKENWTIITNDKDFGEKVFRERLAHNGIILLRLQDERYGNKIEVLKSLLKEYPDIIEKKFVVITEHKIRII